jgi:predicted PurR-regulated permease PerM
MVQERFEERYRPLAFWVIVTAVLATMVFMLRPFFDAILLATVLSILMWPIYQRFLKRFEKKVEATQENLAATMTVLSTIVIVLVPIALAGILIAGQIKSMAPQDGDPSAPKASWTVEKIIDDLDKNLQPTLDRVGFKTNIKEWWATNEAIVEEKLKDPVGKFFVSLVRGALTVVIGLLTMFFMLRDAHRIRGPALALIPIPEDQALVILNRLYTTVRGVFIGVVLVSILQSFIATILYFICGVPSPLVFGVATLLLCVIPLLGAPVVYMPLALLLFFQKQYWQAGVLLGGGFVIVSQVDNLVRPFVIGNRINMHPMSVFFSILGGVLMFGPVGLMAGPMLFALMTALLEIIRQSRVTVNSEETTLQPEG